MKRILLIFCISYIGGILLASYTHVYWLFGVAALALSLFIFFLPAAVHTRRIAAIGAGIFLLAGGMRFTLLTQQWEHCYDGLTGIRVQVTGTLAAQPEIKGDAVKYQIYTEQVMLRDKIYARQGRILITVKGSKSSNLPSYGSRITVDTNLEKPAGQRNPGGFNYRTYLFGLGISAIGYAAPADLRVVETGKGNKLLALGLEARKRVLHVIYAVLPEEQAALLGGMLIGDKERLDEDVQQQFGDAGLSHIMAVSGANIAFLLLPLLALMKRLSIRRDRAGILMILFLIFFVAITGFSASVVRAVLMASLVLLGRFLWRQSDIITSLSFAGLILLLWNPYQLYHAGFQLSFGATLAIVLLYKDIQQLLYKMHIRSFVGDALAVILSAQLGVLPILLIHFNQFTPWALAANLIVTPVLGCITIGGMVLAVLGQISLELAAFAGYFTYPLLSFVLWVSRSISRLPYASIPVATPSFLWIITYFTYLWVALRILPGHKPKLVRIKGAAAAAACTLLLLLQSPPAGQLTAVFMDVGQGDSMVMVSPTGKAVLIDGGGRFGAEGQKGVGERTVIPCLLDLGITQIDVMIATHAHLDHIQGLEEVLGTLRVKRLVIPRVLEQDAFSELLELCRNKKVEVAMCSAGDTIIIDSSTQLEVLSPEKDTAPAAGEMNNTSLVMMLRHGDVSMLLTGDAEQEIEQQLMKQGMPLQAQLMKLGHHGSDSSSTEEFLEAVQPEAAVISVGRNEFGHPAPNILERLEKLGIRAYRTDKEGAVRVKSDGKRLTIQPMLAEEEP